MWARETRTLQNAQEIRNRTMLKFPGEYSKNPTAREWEMAEAKQDEIDVYKSMCLQQLVDKTGMPIVQENGQRLYGPPENVPPPPKGSEVFVGKIPKDIFEYQLVPIFETAGRIYQVRLMMDFNGNNRGFCFVEYFSPEEANLAIKKLNHFEIRKNCRIGVVKSVNNRCLSIGNLPKMLGSREVYDAVDSITEGVNRVRLCASSDPEEANNGNAVVEFKDHKAAAMAKRKLSPGSLQLLGLDIIVDWAEPDPPNKHVGK